MALRFLLDTHIIVRWLSEPLRLSREQARVLNDITRTGEPVALSGISLVEIAVLFTRGHYRMKSTPAELLGTLDDNPAFQVLPITIDIVAEVATMGGSLSDPADRAIVATARVHRLRLITSDQRIIESRLVAIVD